MAFEQSILWLADVLVPIIDKQDAEASDARTSLIDEGFEEPDGNGEDLDDNDNDYPWLRFDPAPNSTNRHSSSGEDWYEKITASSKHIGVS